MKIAKTFLILFLISLSHTAISQNYGYFDVRKGFGDFVLGAAKKNFDSSTLRLTADVFTWKGRTENAYQFMPAKTNPYLLAGVPFSDIILTFGQHDSLFRISLIKAEVKRMNKDYADSSRSRFQSLYQLMKASWDKNGKKKITNPGFENTVTRYDWENGNVLMVLALNEDNGKGISIIEFSLEYKN